jgi:multi-heme cytochrome with CxxCH motif
MSFRSVFLAVVIAFALILSAFLINRARPRVETEQPSAEFVSATGKCAEGAAAMTSGCEQCHSVGKPNSDGTIGNCTACHTRHSSSVRIARLPSTCAQCHMGPDHSQIEIYEESKHGVMFQAQERLLSLDAPPKTLTTRDMFVPT